MDFGRLGFLGFLVVGHKSPLQVPADIEAGFHQEHGRIEGKSWNNYCGSLLQNLTVAPSIRPVAVRVLVMGLQKPRASMPRRGENW